jgi:hypothetical protein
LKAQGASILFCCTLNFPGDIYPVVDINPQAASKPWAAVKKCALSSTKANRTMASFQVRAQGAQGSTWSGLLVILIKPVRRTAVNWGMTDVVEGIQFLRQLHSFNPVLLVLGKAKSALWLPNANVET